MRPEQRAEPGAEQVVSLAGCVQSWFPMAMMKTVLIESACAAAVNSA